MDRLFRNDLEIGADGSRRVTFTDVTDGTGQTIRDYGMGIAAADYDHDGDVDLYLTNFGPLYLEQSGERVRGCYDDGTAVVSGRLDGRVMRLDWREASGFGVALLTVSSGGDFLNGLWYEGSELRGTWRGPRDPENPEPPCEIGQVSWSEE